MVQDKVGGLLVATSTNFSFCHCALLLKLFLHFYVTLHFVFYIVFSFMQCSLGLQPIIKLLLVTECCFRKVLDLPLQPSFSTTFSE